MFFSSNGFNEKTLRDIIENQRKREEALKQEQPKPGLEYDGHVLQIFQGLDGSTLIEATPPLIKEIEGDKSAPAGDVDVLTPSGWVRKT